MELRPVVKVMLPYARAATAYVKAAGYTQWSTAALGLWSALGCPSALGAILWCNSCGIAFSYEMTRVVGEKSLRSLKQQIVPYSDVVLHILPFVILRKVPSAQPSHALLSVTAHALWGAAHDFDLNRVYALNPTLSRAAMRFLWACSLLGHVAGTMFCFDDVVSAVQGVLPFTLGRGGCNAE